MVWNNNGEQRGLPFHLQAWKKIKQPPFSMAVEKARSSGKISFLLEQEGEGGFQRNGWDTEMFANSALWFSDGTVKGFQELRRKKKRT